MPVPGRNSRFQNDEQINIGKEAIEDRSRTVSGRQREDILPTRIDSPGQVDVVSKVENGFGQGHILQEARPPSLRGNEEGADLLETKQGGVWGGLSEDIPARPRGEDDIHLIFSTDCSPYQNYQSLLLFHSAEEVGQSGRVTRVASGCSESAKMELEELMRRQPDRFRVHFTPDFSHDSVTGKTYHFYNKPNGMAHFLEHATPPIEEAVLALIDPDMVLVRKLTPNVGDPSLMLWSVKESEPADWVEEGKPVSQSYGLGGIWTEWKDIMRAELGEDTPALKVSNKDAIAYYAVGPPYMMHPRDWTRVIDLWVLMAPPVNRAHPSILAEMYGFCMATAHLGLRHRIAYGLMVSYSKMENTEGWPLVDVLGTEACDEDVVARHATRLPPIIHYCQMLRVGTYVFGKRRKEHHSFFSCGADSLQLPPQGYLGSPWGLLRIHPTMRKEGPREVIPLKIGVREGYGICAALRAMNAAQHSYKERYCEPGEIQGGVKRLTDLSLAQLATDYTLDHD
ncbi:unnamed protein product [Choristocarpus tenellus]